MRGVPDLSVIVPVRNGAATLPALFAGLRDQPTGGPSFEVVLVDDGSTDETVAVAGASGLPVRVVTARGRGPAAARNQGAEIARASLLAFLDADCEPQPGWLGAGAEALREGADLVQGRVIPPPQAHLGPWDRTLWVQGPSPLFESANLFVTRELFERIGGFESWLGTETRKELGEDVLFGWRARRRGARIAYRHDALVHHAVFPRGPVGFVAERARLRFFPALVGRVPELRDAGLYRRIFLTRRSAAFDAAVAGLAFAGATRRRWPLLAALPYARFLVGDARAHGRRTPAGVLTRVAADGLGAGALLCGSLTSRTLLL